MQPVLEVKDLSYHPLFSSLSFSLSEGSVVMVSGSNCCGKTTLIKILAGIISTTQSVFLEGQALETIPSKQKQKDLSLLFEENFTFHSLTLQDEMNTICLEYEIPNSNQEEVIDLFSLSSFLKKKIASLTPLQQLKSYLGLVALKHPKVVLLDNPFQKLSYEDKKIILKDFSTLKKMGITILITSSNLEDSLFVDQLLILNQGGILIEGLPLKVLKEDSVLNKIGLQLPFFVDLSLKLQYYNLIDKIYLDQESLVEELWKSN